MIFVLASILVVALILVWLVPVSRGVSRRADALEPALRQLLSCEIPAAFLTVRPKYSRYKFIQISRAEKENGILELELAFPFARWSEDLFPKVVSMASEENLPYEIHDEGDPGLRFVFVRFGDSTSLAAEFSQKVLIDIFGFEKDYDFRARIN